MTSAPVLLRWQLRVAHDLLEATIAPVTQEDLERSPAGRGARAAACYAEALTSEDLIVNGVLAAVGPLALTTWWGRTGVSELPPPGPFDRDAWLQRVRFDLPRAGTYSLAVRTATDEYLGQLPEGTLDPEPACLLTALLLNLAARCGEIDYLLHRSGTDRR